uniref:MOSC domain-containing protein n=1 Tax=Parastrongyloides trichosuri TaxID=131310 RepID=A0A0N4Z7K2_PARTI
MSLIPTTLTLFTLSICSIAGALAVYFINKKEEDEEEEFVKVGKVESLYIYPVKSMRGISVPYIECTRTGAKYNEIKDRSFMIIDKKTSTYVGAKKERKLVLIEPSIEYDHLSSSYVLQLTVNNNSVKVNLNDVINNAHVIKFIKLFDDETCDGYDCGDEVSEFIKSFLDTDKDYRLMYHSDSLFNQRHSVVGAKYSNTDVDQGPHEIKYHDDAPYNLLSKESLDDLNKRYDGQIYMDNQRFRPTIFVSDTNKPYDEDYWKTIQISTIELKQIKPCTRCIMTTIDPLTGEKHPNMEPLRELRKYRLAEGRIAKTYNISPVFGVHFCIKNGGIIKVGDDVYGSYKKIPF